MSPSISWYKYFWSLQHVNKAQSQAAIVSEETARKRKCKCCFINIVRSRRKIWQRVGSVVRCTIMFARGAGLTRIRRVSWLRMQHLLVFGFWLLFLGEWWPSRSGKGRRGRVEGPKLCLLLNIHKKEVWLTRGSPYLFLKLTVLMRLARIIVYFNTPSSLLNYLYFDQWYE